MNQNARLSKPIYPQDILKALDKLGIVLDSNMAKIDPPLIRHARSDSRNVDIESAFIAYRGIDQDGHAFIDEAVYRNCRLIIYESPKAIVGQSTEVISWIRVRSGREAWSHLAALLVGHPQKQLKTVAVTGTNGKTSTVWLSCALLRMAGKKVLGMGTLGISYDEASLVPSQHTTADPDVLYSSMREAVDHGSEYCVMEVSSHSVAQKKVSPLEFDLVGWTNFSRDHMDYHETMQNYWESKTQLLTHHLKTKSRCFIHESLLSENYEPRLESLKLNKAIYGGGSSATGESTAHDPSYRMENIQLNQHGCSFNLKCWTSTQDAVETLNVASPLPGHYLNENLVLAMLIFRECLGRWPSSDELSRVPAVPGRLQPVLLGEEQENRPAIFVDYAHTPDALSSVLSTVRSLTPNRIITVFGCGGNRDRGKRPLMAQASAKYSDLSIVTSDNPRNEKPEDIIAEVVRGFGEASSKYQVEPDRALAIATGIGAAGPDDVVVIAGKGHEAYQIINGKKFDFDDVKVARKSLGLGSAQK